MQRCGLDFSRSDEFQMLSLLSEVEISRHPVVLPRRVAMMPFCVPDYTNMVAGNIPERALASCTGRAQVLVDQFIMIQRDSGCLNQNQQLFRTALQILAKGALIQRAYATSTHPLESQSACLGGSWARSGWATSGRGSQDAPDPDSCQLGRFLATSQPSPPSCRSDDGGPGGRGRGGNISHD